MSTLTLELARASDLVAMAQCMAIDADAFPYPSAPFGARADSARVWVARQATSIEGFLAGRVRGGSLHVEGLAVALDARRRGTGRALLRTCLEHAAQTGLAAVELHVWVGNRGAIALYESEGFTVAQRLRQFYPVAAFGPERDALAMTRVTR
jgi:[ribosomal protein S18]-alanine N-acetyltransferase